MCVAGKQGGRPLEATSGPSLGESRLFYVTDRATGRRLRVDTGAEVSAVPATCVDRSHNPIFLIQAVNSTSISVYAERSLSLNLCLRRVLGGYSWWLTSNERSLAQTSYSIIRC